MVELTTIEVERRSNSAALNDVGGIYCERGEGAAWVSEA
jgi:hypothetical protein